jgi:hypothetical protein
MSSKISQKNINENIVGIIYCEFHNIEGPKITFQVSFFFKQK